MLQDAKNLQQEAVGNLVSLLKNSKQKSIVFKAPTGSGKTFMMADFMNRVLEEDKDVVFLVSSLSKGGLARQNHEKFEEYGDIFPNLQPYLINSEIAGEERLYIPPEYNVYSLPLSLYKKGGRLMQGSLLHFFQTLTGGRLLNGLEKKIVLIKDECHIATNNLDDIPANYISRVLDVSATPRLDRGQQPDVEITNEEAMQAKLIKTIEWGEHEASLEDALEKFQTVKEKYRNLLGVNPCLIVQISNKEKADEELQNEIFPALDKTDLKWMLIVNEQKNCDTNDVMKAKKLPVDKWKKYAKEDTAGIDVIIFKLTISEGWDIPRACMLYQIRDSKSKQLDEQVMGRVRRNPRLLDYENLSEEAQELATTSWIWGIQPEDQARQLAVRLQDEESITREFRVKTTRLKPLVRKTDFDLLVFLSGKDDALSRTSIFTLWREFQKADNEVQSLVNDYATSYTVWRHATENMEEIIKENNQFENNYADSMEVVPDDVSFAANSFYSDNGNHQNISNWVWKRVDGAVKFAFDSEAERDWAEILKDLASEGAVEKTDINNDRQHTLLDIQEEKSGGKEIALWGKNYVGNSEIKFEYYMDALHSSFPDFVMKDTQGRVHIFEVKGVNLSSTMHVGFEKGLYETKARELKKAYQQASVLTDQIFYLPVLKNDIWQITQYVAGEENVLSLEQFQGFVRT